MGAPFSPRSNLIARATLVIAVLFVVGSSAGVVAFFWSPFRTGVDVTPPQPVPFSHLHHVSGLGIDCRYCHTDVETSAFAGMPTTETCMSCHQQLWTDVDMLAPVRESQQTGVPIRWRRVHDLPDFVYFNHSIHLAKGIGCVTCHGRVDRMPLAHKSVPLFMHWCVNCHRHPEQFVRPQDRVFVMDETPSAARGAELVKQYGINTTRLADCSTCHR